jgi:TetR/AcrR family transcriptional regulator, cholesterol catabolism regulator
VPNAERSLTMRRRIRKAAVNQFYYQGFARTTVDEIIAEAGVSKGAFYHHFRSKDEVLAEIHTDMLTKQLERFEQIVRAHDTPTARLYALVVTIVRTIIDDRAMVTLWSREHNTLEPELRASLLALREQLDAILVRTIEDGIAAGEFKRVGPARVVAFGIVGMCTWVQEWFSPKGALTADDLAEVYGTLAVSSLRAG